MTGVRFWRNGFGEEKWDTINDLSQSTVYHMSLH